MRKLFLVSAVCVLGGATAAMAHEGFDFGKWRDFHLSAGSQLLFGFNKPLKESSTESVDQATAENDPRTLATVAHGLHVRVASSEADLGTNIDMIAFWPNDTHPSHLIVCNEVEDPSLPGVQRVRLSDGSVDTILFGTVDCDPVRRTAWGTILVGEEAGTAGQLIEIIKP
ncbi:MAG TPA: hypothetical protein VFK70_15365, partial [Vicinamibacteria bacterium]|nr:hypothetical protein [Vicinamibacteria bacterium]